ncbi:MAG: ATP-binding cassette domain-containing protein [Spirochaetia bacterium]|nr:ATP-binding cassette domain-containing protein [Spirochaetia bacterium]
MLKVINLKKSYNITGLYDHGSHTVKAVDGVDFSVKKGSITALVGESGSGKSTIARCVAGLETPDSGEILIDGMKSDYSTKEKRRRVQYIFQDTLGSLNPRMRVGEALAEPLKYHFELTAAALRDGVADVMLSTGLRPELSSKYPHELSGGQRQRVVIARALAMKPQFLVADEPVSSLDVSVQAQILKLFSTLNEVSGTTMLFITHDLRVVRSLAQDVVVLQSGRVAEYGQVEAVFASPKTVYTRTLLDSIPGAPAAKKKGG